MHDSSLHKSRRRTVAIGLLTFGLISISLSVIVIRQVSRECLAFVEDRRKALADRLDLALSNLNALETAALDRIEQTAGEESFDLRGVDKEQALVANSFVVRGEEILWPKPPKPQVSSDAFPWKDRRDGVGERKLLRDAYEHLARGDRLKALEVLRRLFDAPVSPSVRAEAWLQMANVLAADADAMTDAVACCDRVLELTNEELRSAPDGLTWTAAALLRKAELLINGHEREKAIEPLLSLLDLATAPEESLGRHLTVPFYRDRAAGILSGIERDGLLAPDDERRLSELNDRVIRIRSGAEFYADLRRIWLPILYAEAPDASQSTHHLFRSIQGRARLLTFRRVLGEPETYAGFLVDLDTWWARLLASLSSVTAPGGGGLPLSVLDLRGTVLAGDRIQNGGDSDPPIEVRFPADFPWVVEMPIRDALKKVRTQRSILYGSMLLVVLAAIGVAIGAMLRSIHRRLELAEMKSRFVANVSHELKTPLTLIRMFSDILLLGYSKGGEETQKNLEIIGRESERLSLLIDNVLDLSRIETGDKEYRLESEDIGPLVEHVVDGFRPYLERKGFALRLETEHDLPLLHLDRVAFSQALGNLLSNVVKYSADRKEVDVRAGRDEAGVSVTVVDRGVGLQPGEQEKVFDRFYRSESEGTRDTTGTGIGLAIVKHIVEAHGGSVSAENRAGGGSRFRLHFPTTLKKGGRGGVEDSDH